MGHAGNMETPCALYSDEVEGLHMHGSFPTATFSVRIFLLWRPRQDSFKSANNISTLIKPRLKITKLVIMKTVTMKTMKLASADSHFKDLTKKSQLKTVPQSKIIFCWRFLKIRSFSWVCRFYQYISFFFWLSRLFQT